MSKQVIVDTPLGKLAGAEYTTVRGKLVYTFQGIPYGQPPVGDLRFKSPVPVEKWEGVKEALNPGNNAPSPAIEGYTRLTPAGKEDCLYLNISTPQKPAVGLKIPVFFFIHGGGFTFGEGRMDSYGPDYLVPYGVILVTINYRLGAFGFLSLETPECPGNYGLKDQTLALRWVKDNISAFGGDPDNITIGGESAGSASVHYQLLSPLSKGLFQKAIALSGAATNRWGFSRYPRKSAILLATKMGCKSQDPKEVLEFLRKAEVDDILNNSTTIFLEIEGLEPSDATILNFPFVPCVEPTGTADAFITRRPADLIADGEFHDVPYITGVCEREAVFLLSSNDYVPTLNDQFFKKLLPRELNITETSPKVLEAINKIREFYFPDGPTHDGYLRVMSTVEFGYGIGKAAAAIAKKGSSPAYLYTFKGSRAESLVKIFFKINHPATAHAEDLDFMFHRAIPPQKPIVEGSEEDATLLNMCSLWTDFIKTGQFATQWPEADIELSKYLAISNTLEVRDNFLDGEIQLWDNVYEILTN